MPDYNKPDYNGSKMDIVTSSVRNVPGDDAHPMQRVALYGAFVDGQYRPHVATLDAETGEVLYRGYFGGSSAAEHLELVERVNALDAAVDAMQKLIKELLERLGYDEDNLNGSVKSAKEYWALSDGQGARPAEAEFKEECPPVPWGKVLWRKSVVAHTGEMSKPDVSYSAVSGPQGIASSGVIGRTVSRSSTDADTVTLSLEAGDGLAGSSGSVSVDSTVARKEVLEASSDAMDGLSSCLVEGCVCHVTGTLSMAVEAGGTISVSGVSGTPLYATPGWVCDSDGSSMTATAGHAFAKGSPFRCVLVC